VGAVAIITISRGTFTGGQALAECLADKLGYQCLSREVILDAAAAYGVPVERFIEAMEKPPSFWERLTGERSDYLNYTRAALLERARTGNLVYHGYAGHLLLPGISHVIRVRAIADLESRIETAMDRDNVSRKDAIARIKRIDKERADWMRFLFNVDWQDASLYDVVVNVSRLGVEGACDLVAAMPHMSAFQPTVQSRKAMDDLALASRVWIALAADPVTDGASLKATADSGSVIVTGTAISWDVVDAIQGVAARVEGVRTVTCEVSVNPMYATPI
jgi:cytidylate kinase